MVVIRLRRGGRRHDPHYRLVVQEKRSKLNGAYIENLGHYHPTDPQKQLVIDQERAVYWLQQGAVASDTAINLLVKAGILDAEHRITKQGKPKTAEAPVEEAEAAPAEEPSSEEAPAEEAAPAA